MTKCAELLNRTIDVDFVDINVGCPIDLVYKKVRAVLPWSQARGPALLASCLSFPIWTWCTPSWVAGSSSMPVGSVCFSGGHRVSVSHRVAMRVPVGSVCVSGGHSLCVPQGGGCALMNRSAKFQQIVRGVNEVSGALRLCLSSVPRDSAR